jgi:diguanylate cyclase (GGDEF)-like protein
VERERLLSESLVSIRHLLSHLQGEVAALETSWSQVLLVLSKLEEACSVDELTGILRRNAFFEQWEILSLGDIRGGNARTGVILVDLDHFKRINDTYGHAGGDQVIRAVGELLSRFQETGRCIAGRLGGEEFGLVMRGGEDELLGTAQLIRRMISRLEFTSICGAREWTVTASLGVAIRDAEMTSAQAMLSADEALYRAKGEGRDRVCAA